MTASTLSGPSLAAHTSPDERQDRRTRRYRVRDHVQVLTGLDRVAACGRRLTGSNAVIVRSPDGVARYTGVQTCGSIWACPVCSAKIRQRRADELHAGLVEHLRRGGGAYFVTLTIRHHSRQPLAHTLAVLQDAYRRMQQGRRRVWRPDPYAWGPDRNPIIGVVRATEITHGTSGWHPHIHALILTRRPLSHEAENRLRSATWTSWNQAVTDLGGPSCTPVREAFRFERACDLDAVAQYLAKVSDSEQIVTVEDRRDAHQNLGRMRSLSLELARSDLKAARRTSRHPFQIAADGAALVRLFGEVSPDVDLWREYETATRGRRAMSWSRGLRRYLAEISPDVDAVERTDEDLADDSLVHEDDQVIAMLSAHVWSLVVNVDGLRARLLTLAEVGGTEAVRRELAQFEPVGGMPERSAGT